MIATLAALQLLLLTQNPPLPQKPPPKGATPAEPAQAPQDPPAAQPGAEAQPAAPAEPTPAQPTPPAQPEATPPPARRSASADAGSRLPRQLSLLSGESLHGGTASLAWAGWSSLGLMYGQGVTPDDDLAGYGDFDWANTELRLGGMYRRPIGQAGDFDVAARLTLAWYRDMGATYVHSDNHADTGFEIGPGIALSRHAAEGIFSGIVEAPMTITFKYGKGFLFMPRVSVAYEARLFPDFTVGARLGVGYRAGSGDAPRKAGQGEVLFLVVAGYQLL
ncbi:MAG TPA: hypothetical protein VFK90_11885 [Anaeromyxobacter sp.]|nr:hypothetical protein [Anaeromyxobacter sp.]